MSKDLKKSKEIIAANNNYFKCVVVTRNIITDWVQGIRNMLGLELTSYANIINLKTKELIKQMPKMKWYKIDIEELGCGGFMIAVYGDKE